MHITSCVVLVSHYYIAKISFLPSAYLLESRIRQATQNHFVYLQLQSPHICHRFCPVGVPGTWKGVRDTVSEVFSDQSFDIQSCDYYLSFFK